MQIAKSQKSLLQLRTSHFAHRTFYCGDTLIRLMADGTGDGGFSKSIGPLGDDVGPAVIDGGAGGVIAPSGDGPLTGGALLILGIGFGAAGGALRLGPTGDALKLLPVDDSGCCDKVEVGSCGLTTGVGFGGIMVELEAGAAGRLVEFARPSWLTGWLVAPLRGAGELLPSPVVLVP
jgi:hypothetical protein